jgi:Flp pilus assembly pilin Flp
MAIKLKPNKNRLKTLDYPCGEETVMDLILNFSADEAGASGVEYALLVAFIATIIAASVSMLGSTVNMLFALSFP